MIKILTPQQISVVDTCTVEHEPIASIDLMERAAQACARWIAKRFNSRRKVIVFVGPGNNGGDGLAVARLLRDMMYDVSVYMLTGSSHLSEDASVNYRRLSECTPEVLTGDNFPVLSPSYIVIDALFGTGLSRPLEGLAAQTVASINNSESAVIAIDVPSGLFCGDNGSNNPHAIIRAGDTLTFQQPKLSFFFAENAPYTGRWHVLDIGLSRTAIEQQPSDNFMLSSGDISGWIKPREKFAHKGNFGHACIIAGHQGMTGAAVLAAKACLRSGAGLVTAHIPQNGNLIMQVSVPEVLVSSDSSPDFISQIPDMGDYSAIGIGPGIGKHKKTQTALLALLHMAGTEKSNSPANLVLDADALNILSYNRDWLKLLPPNSILTPHPKEFDRIADSSPTGYERYLRQMEFSRKHAAFVVLKGAHTSVTTPAGRCFFNATGNPGMATGGSGDVLTGIIVSLLAQGWPPYRAACAGVWLHGAAGDIAAADRGQQALTASDIIENIGQAFKMMIIR